MTASVLWRQKSGLDEPEFHPSQSRGNGPHNSNGLGFCGEIQLIQLILEIPKLEKHAQQMEVQQKT